jgi:hypothetical protein
MYRIKPEIAISIYDMDAAVLLNESLQNKPKLIQSSGCQR